MTKKGGQTELVLSLRKKLEVAEDEIDGLTRENKALQTAVERLEEQLDEAELFAHMPKRIRVEKLKKSTRVYCDDTGLELKHFKLKGELADGKDPSVELRFKAELVKVEILQEQVEMFGDDAAPAPSQGTKQAAN